MIYRILLLSTVLLSMSIADVILDDFENHYNDPANQGHIGAAYAQTGKVTIVESGCFWYIFTDANGSQVTTHDGTPVNPTTVENLVYGDGIMHCKLTTKNSTNPFPFSGLGIPLIGHGDSLFADLSAMTGIKMRIKGSSSAKQALRFRLETKDFVEAGEDWGFYGYPIDLDMSPTEYKEVIVPVSKLFPEKYSPAWDKDWVWTNGAAAVNKFAFQVKDGNEAEIHLDYIVFMGVDYTAFGFAHTDAAGLPAPSTENLARIFHEINPNGTSLTALPAGCSFTLPGSRQVLLSVYNSGGQLIKTLLSGRVPAGQTIVHWDSGDNTGAPAGRGSYIYSLKAGDIREAKAFTRPD